MYVLFPALPLLIWHNMWFELKLQPSHMTHGLCTAPACGFGCNSSRVLTNGVWSGSHSHELHAVFQIWRLFGAGSPTTIQRIARSQMPRSEYKYSCTSTLSPGEADLARENNYPAPAPANRLRLGTSSGADYIFSIHPPFSPTPAV